MHDLRHTAITHLIRAGADVGQVARFAGHARPSMTLDKYLHEFEARKGNDVATRLATALEGALP
jgi:integrase